MIDIIIDIETLGTKPGCPIIEIGACSIDPVSGVIVANFSRRVNHKLPSGYFDAMLRAGTSSLGADLYDTVVWWTSDADRSETFRRITSGGQHANWVMQVFLAWYKFQILGLAPETVRVWANGPQFDLVILQAALSHYDITRPWICWQERCVRTALEQAGYERGSVPWVEQGPRHRALNDARHEARKLYHAGALGEVSAIIKRVHQRGTQIGENK